MRFVSLDSKEEQTRFTNNLERIDIKYLSEYILIGGSKRRKGDKGRKEGDGERKKRDRYEDEEEDKKKKNKKKKKKDKDGDGSGSEDEDDDEEELYYDDEDRWIWTETGKKIKYSIDWAPGQPNNGNNERCLALAPTQGRYRFHDVPCDTLRGRYFCQK